MKKRIDFGQDEIWLKSLTATQKELLRFVTTKASPSGLDQSSTGSLPASPHPKT